MNKSGVRGVVIGVLIGVACCLLFLNLTGIPATAAAQGKADAQHWYQMAMRDGEIYVIDQATGDIYEYEKELHFNGQLVHETRWLKAIAGPPKEQPADSRTAPQKHGTSWDK